jgi:putative SOS response-associated peptidase YedK
MCGRYRRRSDKQKIAEAFAVYVGLDELQIEPEEDIAPGSIQPVVRLNDEGERQIEFMRWGFKKEDGRLLFNARSEGIETANFWKKAFNERRCIVPADSFFEWRKVQTGKKPKYEFTIHQGQLFGMAGLWSRWKNPKSNLWEDTFAIMTVDANETVATVHDRQPAILDPREYREYLEETDRPPVYLLRSLPSEEMDAQEVDQEIISNKQVGLFDSL